eukprot:scaffold1900_cov389-Prasinococcus_capsulatus_cf.AAC.25
MTACPHASMSTGGGVGERRGVAAVLVPEHGVGPDGEASRRARRCPAAPRRERHVVVVVGAGAGAGRRATLVAARSGDEPHDVVLPRSGPRGAGEAGGRGRGGAAVALLTERRLHGRRHRPVRAAGLRGRECVARRVVNAGAFAARRRRGRRRARRSASDSAALLRAGLGGGPGAGLAGAAAAAGREQVRQAQRRQHVERALAAHRVHDALGVLPRPLRGGDQVGAAVPRQDGAQLVARLLPRQPWRLPARLRLLRCRCGTAGRATSAPPLRRVVLDGGARHRREHGRRPCQRLLLLRRGRRARPPPLEVPVQKTGRLRAQHDTQGHAQGDDGHAAHLGADRTRLRPH